MHDCMSADKAEEKCLEKKNKRLNRCRRFKNWKKLLILVLKKN